MQRIAVLTSGGDAPGMNAAVRAVVDQGGHYGIDVYGVYHGYKGLVEGDFRLLKPADTQHALKVGGTMLYSSRFPEFAEPDYQAKAVQQLKDNQIDGLVVIGGDGSFQGALALTKLGFPAVGIPGTIDNDIPGTEYTIGFDTAVSSALESIDRISDTAASHNRTFVIEVMGRHAGDIAIWAGVAAGADAIVVPENPFDMEDIARRVKSGRKHGKDYSLIVLAEGVSKVEDFVEKYQVLAPDESVRGVTLSHVQRGGAPTSRDRVFATLMGARAVDCLRQGKQGIYLGVQGEQLAEFDIVDTLGSSKHKIRQDLYNLNRDLNDRM